ncbi:anti-sigma factor family protein, partial [Micromonospora sp. NPDC004336]
MSRCEFAHDDGAYVLGALAPAERAAYERHLAGCAPCRQAVADIAVLPGLLGRLDPAGLEQLLPPPENPRVPELLSAARERRRRERSAA